MTTRTKAAISFTRDDALRLLKAKPFRPFKLRMNNGRVFDVRLADDLWAGLSGSLVFDSGRNDFGISDVQSVVEVVMRSPLKRRKNPR